MMVNPPDPTLSDALADATERALLEAEIRLPPDVLAALRGAAATERDEIARRELGNILENIALAEERRGAGSPGNRGAGGFPTPPPPRPRPEREKKPPKPKQNKKTQSPLLL